MVETAEKTRPTQKGVSFREKLCQGLELNPKNPQRRFIALLQEHGDVAAVAIALEDSLIRNQPFNGNHPLSSKLVEVRLTSFAVEVVKKSESNLLPPLKLEDVEDMMLQVVLRLRAALGCSNTRAERDRVSWEYWQRLQIVTTGR